MMKIMLIVLLTCSITTAFSQENFRKAYILTLAGDTLRGAIDHKEWGDRPKDILFKNAADGIKTVYSSKQIKYFEIEGKVAYRSFVGFVTNDTDMEAGVGGLDTSKIYISTFLNYVRKGPTVSLLKYYDSNKTRYFIEDEQAHIVTELVQYLYYSNNGLGIRSLKRYKKQLYDIAAAKNALTNDVEQRIESANYNEDNLLYFISKINKTDENQIVVKKKAKPVRLFIGTALNIASAKYVGANILASNVKREGSYFPKITAGVDIFRDPDIGKLIFRFEVSLTQASFKFRTDVGEGPINNYKQIITTVSPQVIYNIYNTDRAKIYLGGGIGLNYLIYKDVYFARAYGDSHIQQLDRDPALAGYLLNFPLRVGAIINKRFEFSLIYSRSFKTGNSYSIMPTFIQPSINYHFN